MKKAITIAQNINQDSPKKRFSLKNVINFQVLTLNEIVNISINKAENFTIETGSSFKISLPSGVVFEDKETILINSSAAAWNVTFIYTIVQDE